MPISTQFLAPAALIAMLCATAGAQAQQAGAEGADAGDAAGAQDAGALLSDADLQTLVAPVALYPDTLLIQILVGATVPFDVMKADRLLLENTGSEPDVVEPLVKAEGFDASVEVLAIGFPDVVHGMADNIDWTETIGDAMLVQSEDVLAAVQVMRDQAIDTGALISNEQQTVATDPATDAVVIQPADPGVVYVPQYEPQAVFGVGDAVTAGLITWGTVSIIDEIFDDDDDWNDYWGCRNCGGWGGGPIIRDPDIDIDVDGNVNIGNIVGSGNLGDRLDGEGNLIDRDRPTTLPGQWKPDTGRGEDARDRIAAAKGNGGAVTLPAKRPSDSDALRAKLADRTGAADIARPQGRPATRDSLRTAAGAGAGAGAGAAGGALASRGTVDKIKAKSPGDRPQVKKAVTKTKPAAKPQIKRPAAQAQRAAPKIAKKSSGHKARAAGTRGKGKAGKIKKGRR